MTDQMPLRIAAILYKPSEGASVDLMLTGLAAELKAQNVRLAGTVQWNRAAQAGPCADMIMEDLHSGRHISVTENRGAMAMGCRLDSRALEDVAGLTRASIGEDTDLVIINKFSKSEADGGGLRQAIEAAVTAGVPVLVALNTTHRDAWDAFTGGCSHWLAADPQAIRTWCRDVLKSSDHPIPASL